MSDSDIQDVTTKTPRRVKVYLLQGEDWLDNGTGYCSGEVDASTKKPFFIVRNELNPDEVILKSYLEGSIQYQRQQETLIVWTDLTEKDLALSFQETEGCAEVCEFIIKVQQHEYSPDISLYYVIPNLGDDNTDITELITGPITYPEDPTLDNLDAVLETSTQGSNSQYTRSSIAKHIVSTDFIPKLIDAFEAAEQAHRLLSLFTITEIAKTLLLYNETALIEKFTSTHKNIMGLAGIFEYDSEYALSKACHRDILADTSRFKTVIEVPETSPGLDMFRRDYYLNYLKNTVFARFLDDPTFSTFNSLIYFNQVEIIDFLKDSTKNNHFLSRLFALYEGDASVEKRRDGVKLLHQYVLIAKSLQAAQKLLFFLVLVNGGLVKMLSFALEDTDDRTRVLGTELIVIIIEQDAFLVNAIDESERPPGFSPDSDDARHRVVLSTDMTIPLILSKLLLGDKNSGLKMQAFEALRMLLDSNLGSGLREDDDVHDDVDVNSISYFEAFYREVAPSIFQHFIDLANGKDCIPTIQSNELTYLHLCDLISFCLKEHDTSVSKPFFLEHRVILGVSRLVAAKVKTPLRLSALRCLKSVVLLNDDQYTSFIIDQQVLDPVFEYFDTIVHLNNLANLTCLELVDCLVKNCDQTVNRGRRHNFKRLARHVYDSHKGTCERIDYVSTGSDLIKLVEHAFYDNNNNKQFKSTVDSDDEVLNSHNVSTPIQSDSEPENCAKTSDDEHPDLEQNDEPDNLEKPASPTKSTPSPTSTSDKRNDATASPDADAKRRQVASVADAPHTRGT